MKRKTDKTARNFNKEVGRLIGRLYEESQDEPECLYWQAANKLEMALDRIRDLLMEEDGHAQKEAEKFLEQFDQ